MKHSRHRHLATLPRVFQIDTGEVDTALVTKIFKAIILSPGSKIRNLLQQVNGIKLRPRDDSFHKFCIQLPSADFRERWYNDWDTADHEIPKPLFAIVENWIAQNHKNLGFDSPELFNFFEKRQKNKIFPRLEHIEILSNQLISTAEKSAAESALYAWSLLESTQWHSISQPNEESLTRFRDVLLADLKVRSGAMDLLEQLEDGVFISDEMEPTSHETEPSPHKKNTGKPIDSVEVEALEDNPEPESTVPLNKSHALPKTAEGVEISQCASVQSVDCWVDQIDELVSKAGELKKSSERFAKNVKQLTEFQNRAAFDGSGDIASLLSSLESDRKLIQNQNHDIQLSLTAPCKNPDGKGCELLQFLRQIQENPAATPNELIANVGEMRKKADTLFASAQAGRLEFKALSSQATELMGIVGSSDQILNQLDQNTPPCRILEAASEQRRVISNLKSRLSFDVGERRGALINECNLLEAKYNFDTDPSLRDSHAKFVEIRSRIVSAETIKQIESCRLILKEFEAKCIEIEYYNPQALASLLHEKPDVLPVFLDLCRSLIDQGEPEVAFLLLQLRQHLHQIEEISEHTDQALTMLLETTCEVASGEFSLSIVWNTLCTAPWLISIGKDDIQSSDLHERFVIALLGAALWGDTERAATILVNIGAAELNRQSFPSALYEVIHSIITRRPIQFASAKELASRDDQERIINESIALDGSKYRHLQCGKATHFARFETIQIFPAMSELWHTISSDMRDGQYTSAHARVDNLNVNDWYEELVRKHDKPIDEHPHFPKKIRTFMGEFLACIQGYIAHCEEVWGGDNIVLAEDEFKEALQQWAGRQKERSVLIDLVIQNLTPPLSEGVQPKSFWNTLDLCKPIILQCPRFIVGLRAQQNPEPDLQLEQLIFEDLALDIQLEEVVRILVSDSAWEQLSVLHQSTDVVLDRDWRAKHERDLANLADRRNEVLATKNQSQIDIFDACVQGGRFPAALQILEKCAQQNANIRMQEKQAVSSFVDDQIKNINAVRDTVEDVNMPEVWQDSVGSLAAKIETQVRNLRHSEDSGDVLEVKQLQLGKAIDALSFVVREKTKVFDAVEHHLDFSKAKDNPHPITANEQKIALEKCPELHKNWGIMATADSSEEGETKRGWIQFVKEFAKVCNLYRDEHDEKNRFFSVPSIKYPFSVYETAFYKPQSEFLKRRLRLYLYCQSDVDAQALQRLEAELSGDNSAAWLHILFAPQGSDKVRRYFKYDKGFKNFLIVDESFLYQMSLADKHDVPVRQALHASVTDLASSSPFVAQGYCHQSNNIYVGRTEILNKLQNTPQAMIWGGRRIGKTSVLHALESALSIRKYNVAYVYVDIQDNGDPDLSIAKKIATTLGLRKVESLTDFESEITKLRNSGQRFAFLIDEVDEYIKKSKKVYGQEFPLATVLRQLVMDDSTKGTILVYSGYHQLYFEAKLNKDKRRVGHPFINTAQDISIRDLTHDDVNELVKTGFEEMLGMTISPEVPTLISRLASRHPAFVQQFCRCLLEQVSKRRSPGKRVTITGEDVEAVYAANASTDGGEQPFIFYVSETLGYNLSHLGRAIMISICLDPDSKFQTERKDDYFSIQKIKSELNDWCDVIGVEHPELEHFQQTIELLEMTNMLTQNPKEHGKYRVTYLTYIEILRRLDNLRKADLQESLRQYDSKERKSGVLL